MAKQTYAQLQQQIATLNAQAEQLRRDEVGEVVAKIKEAIKAYDISSVDLFGAGGRATGVKSKSLSKSVGKSKSKSADKSAKFSDGQGGEWVGRGPRPKWLRDAIASGRRLEEFAVGGAGESGAAAKTGSASMPVASKKKGKSKSKRKSLAPKQASAPKYSDGAGKQWTGRGPQPGWLKAALAEGRSIDEFKV